MRIGIFGGSFNPPHILHKRVAQALLAQGILDKIIVVPTNNGYEKDGLIDIDERVKMLEMCFFGEKNIEIKKCKLNYTIDVLDYFQKVFKDDEIFFIMGSDNYKQLASWHDYKRIISDYKLIVFLRGDDKFDAGSGLYEGENTIFAEKIDDCSSTEIREILAEKKFPKNLQKDVYRYIKKNNFYGEKK